MENIDLIEIAKSFKFTRIPKWCIEFLSEKQDYSSLNERDHKSFFILSNFISSKYLNDNLFSSDYKAEHISSLVILSKFVLDKTTDNHWKTIAYINYGIYKMAEALNSQSSINLNQLIIKFEQLIKKINGKRQQQDEWKKIIVVITKYLNYLRTVDAIKNKNLCDDFIRDIADKIDFFELIEIENFLKEIIAHEASDNMSMLVINQKIQKLKQPDAPVESSIDKMHTTLQGFIGNAHLDEAKKIIEENKEIIFSILSKKLVGKYDETLPPQRGNERITEAKKFIFSDDRAHKQEGLKLFENFYRTSHNNYKDNAYEWLLYARCVVDGMMTVLLEWEELLKSGKVTEEIKWNLAAVYVRLKEQDKALQVLRKDLDKSPLAHLKFALHISLQLYQSSPKDSPQYKESLDFLIENLYKYPVPEALLVHLLLSFERNENMRFGEYPHFNKYIKLCNNQIEFYDTSGKINERDLESLQQELLSLKLDSTWRMWLNEYAGKHRLDYKVWNMLSNTCMRIGDLQSAEDALAHILSLNEGFYHRAKKTGKEEEDINRQLRFFRISLVEVFKFYKQQALLDKGKSLYKKYKNNFPELWDLGNPSNRVLLDHAKSFIGEGVSISSNQFPIRPYRVEKTYSLWITLNEEISKVVSLEMLKPLKERINAAIDLISGNNKIEEEKNFIKILSNELCEFDQEQTNAEQLKKRFNEISGKIKSAKIITDQEIGLREIKPLSSSFIRIFNHLEQKFKYSNKPIFKVVENYEGLATDISESSLLVTVANQGEDNIENLELTCSSNDAVINSRDKCKIEKILENSSAIEAIPILIDSSKRNGFDTSSADITFNYSWGILKNLQGEHKINVNWFSFSDYLNKHNITDKYEFPKPYLENTPIDFEKKPLLFQGRDEEIKFIISRFIEKKEFFPIYFHGIRRVGKTSLRNKINLELKNHGFNTVSLELNAYNPNTQSLGSILHRFTKRIIEGINIQNSEINLSPIPEDTINPLLVAESFFESVYSFCGKNRIILLLDEFHIIVHPLTADLLDLFRSLVERGILSLIMFGLKRPGILEKNCKTQFTYANFPVDFFNHGIIKKILTEPIKEFGIKFHESTIERIFLQSAGNPFHISKIANGCIDILNAEHRNIIVPSDIDKVADILALDKANFNSSTLSSLVVESEELNKVSDLAKNISDYEIGIPFGTAEKILTTNIMRELEDKKLIERISNNNIRIKGKMLTKHLQVTSYTGGIIPPPDKRKKVGIFIDYENISNSGNVKDALHFAKAIINYASKFGNIVCKWACSNFMPYETKVNLETGGLDVTVKRKIASQIKNIADIIIIDRINDELDHINPDIFIIVSGDSDYGITVQRLIEEKNKTVRIVASRSSPHLSSEYDKYLLEREKHLIAEGKTLEKDMDFFIDDIDEIMKN